MPENLSLALKPDSELAIILGAFRGYLARANVEILRNDGNFWGHKIIIHEMTHAIEYAIAVRNLIPNLGERLDTSFAKEMEKVRIRTEGDGDPYRADTEWADRPSYCMANGGSHDNASEFWAWYVERSWFDLMFNPGYLADPNWNALESDREDCPNLTGITKEVFPKFSLHFAVETRGYETEDGRILRR